STHNSTRGLGSEHLEQSVDGGQEGSKTSSYRVQGFAQGLAMRCQECQCSGSDATGCAQPEATLGSRSSCVPVRFNGLPEPRHHVDEGVAKLPCSPPSVAQGHHEPLL